MMGSSRTLNLVALGFFFAVIIIVFWQIETDFKEQGIASGGPYDNAASYPRMIAIFMGVLLGIQFAIELSSRTKATAPDVVASNLGRAAAMLAVFAAYLMVLTIVGYHLATAPMILAIMWICGIRDSLKLVLVSIAIATGFAFVFETFLNVVLPLGIWNIFIPW